MRIGVSLALLVLPAVAAGCGLPPPHDGGSIEGADASAICTRRCTRCHAPPERMKHTRAELAEAFGRHRARIKLTAEQWQSIADYLARPD